MCAIILTTTITIATLMVSKAKFWKMHLELNPKNCKQESKNNNLLGVDMGKEIESTSDVDEKKIPHNTQYNSAEGGELEQSPSQRGEGDDEVVPYQDSSQEEQG